MGNHSSGGAVILTLEFVALEASFSLASIGLWRPQVGQRWCFQTQWTPTKRDSGASVETQYNTIELQWIDHKLTFGLLQSRAHLVKIHKLQMKY